MTLGSELHEVHADLGADEHEGEADLGSVADESEGAVLDLLALGEVLEHGHEVAHLLRGMVELGHTVDHGHSGAFGETNDILMTVNAGHHDVEQGAHDASGVAEGLMTTELDGARAVELGVAAKVGHSGLEGETGAGGNLLEDHAKALVAEQVRIIAALLDGLLHGNAEILDGENLFLGEVICVNEILNHYCLLCLLCPGFLSGAPNQIIASGASCVAVSVAPEPVKHII